MEAFQPTRPLRGATQGHLAARRLEHISTHAPLAGRDGSCLRCCRRFSGFQPTRPLRGATTPAAGGRRGPPYFNPRAPCGARRIIFWPCPFRTYFNPRAPCGARRLSASPLAGSVYISTHAPLAGRDHNALFEKINKELISTHAPLAGRDASASVSSSSPSHFNPRAPCGARRTARPWWNWTSYFNPRAPCGARQQKCTNHYAHFCDNRQISDAFAQNAACQGILLLFDAGKSCGFWVRTAQVISAHLCFAL